MSHHESQAKGPDARMVDRMLFFSDAVFAIVLTLLALELRAPEYAALMTLLLLVSTRGSGKLMGGISTTEYLLRITQSIAPVIAFAAGIFFCAHGMAWEARFAAFLMFPIMWLGRLIFRMPKAPKA